MNEPVPLYDEDPSKSFVKPICLPWKEDDPGRIFKKDATAVVTGWGKIKTSLKDIERKKRFGASARWLLYVQLPIANDICSSDPVLEPYWDPETKVCAGGEKGNVFISCLNQLHLCHTFMMHTILIFMSICPSVHPVCFHHNSKFHHIHSSRYIISLALSKAKLSNV